MSVKIRHNGSWVDTSGFGAGASAWNSGPITIAGAGSGNAIRVIDNATPANDIFQVTGGALMTLSDGSPPGGASVYIFLNGTNGNTIFEGDMINSGDMFVGGTFSGGTSDIKYKENISDAPSQIADVAALKLRTWDWKENVPGKSDKNSRHTTGLIAQEAETVDNKLVYNYTASGPAGALQKDETFKGIDHDVLIMKLLGAVQDLNKELSDVKARLSALEGG